MSLLVRRLISAPMSMPTANEATMMIVSISLQVKLVAPPLGTISDPGREVSDGTPEEACVALLRSYATHLF